MADQNADIKDTPNLIVTAFRQFTQLMQDEVALAKAELSRNISRAGFGLALIAVAALLALTALDILAAAVVAYLAATVFSLGTAAMAVGGALLTVAFVLAFAGKRRLSAEAIVPDRAIRNVEADIDAVKEATNA
ncbi:MAG: phage holin family protein [Pseudomonadota bacterium]